MTDYSRVCSSFSLLSSMLIPFAPLLRSSFPLLSSFYPHFSFLFPTSSPSLASLLIIYLELNHASVEIQKQKEEKQPKKTVKREEEETPLGLMTKDLLTTLLEAEAEEERARERRRGDVKVRAQHFTDKERQDLLYVLTSFSFILSLSFFVFSSRFSFNTLSLNTLSLPFVGLSLPPCLLLQFIYFILGKRRCNNSEV